MSLPPDFDPNLLKLREATEEEKIICWRNNSESWKGKLTIEEYIGQQLVNGDQELTRNGGIRYWIFTNETEIYASAETVKKPVVMRTGGDRVSTEWSYGVAAVFTPPVYRRRGIASCMMRKLGDWFDSDEASCRFTALWSAVGGFYQSFGWSIFATLEAIVPVTPTPSNEKLGVTMLTKDSLLPLCDDNVNTVISNIRDTPLPGDKQTRLAFLPTYAQATWHFGSEEYVASKLFPSPQRIPSIKGAMSSNGKVWGYWFHDYNADKLILLHLVVPQDTDNVRPETEIVTQISQVLQAAQTEAASWGLKKVSIWDPHPRILAACEALLGTKPEIREEIEGNIPCLRWRGDKGTLGVEERVEWILREMYPWC
ncbi:hypothetical protein F4805DRAFT_357561 [Annulohypoxylon moriforme]|nr:hypothetical protein F4805DRAFT_357561 [Annulohypoxylon moriforme]